MNNKSEENKKINRIAVFTNGWSNEFIKMVLEGICEEAKKDGADVFVFVSFVLDAHDANYRELQRNIYSLVNPDEYDGVIIFSNTYADREELDFVCSLWKDTDIPIVSTEVEIPGFSYIGTSNYSGMHELARHLVEDHDVKDVVYVSGFEGNAECNVRKGALEDVLREHNLQIRDEVRGNFEYYRTRTSMTEWLKAGNKVPDAFVCANDLMALGVMCALYEEGLRVPEDVLVTGFDHIHEAQICYPLLATVTRQWDNLGNLAYQELKSRIQNNESLPKTVFESKFLPSESCGCKPCREDVETRLNKLRNTYEDQHKESMVEYFFQAIRIDMAGAGSKEEFIRRFKWSIRNRTFFGQDYSMCVDPRFFDMGEEEYEEKVRQFGDKMEVVYDRRNGVGTDLREANRSDVYPLYEKEEGKSNVYVAVQLSHINKLIGYLVIKNCYQVLYDQRFRRLLTNYENLFVTVKQYIFLQDKNIELEKMYMTDFLSGMYNRLGCDKVISSFVMEEKEKGNNVIMLFCDINGMKIINDEYGHLNGDLAIKATAEALKNSLEEGWLVGRYGGDEFIAAGKYSEEMTPEECRNRFKKALEDIIKGLKIAFELSASIGYYLVKPEDEGEVSDFIRQADASMYEEKQREKKH